MRVNGKIYFGVEAAKILIDRQQQGVKKVVSRGVVVKINTVLIPHINGDHIPGIAQRYAMLGATIMNIMLLIPLGRFADIDPPAHAAVATARRSCQQYIEQFERYKL